MKDSTGAPTDRALSTDEVRDHYNRFAWAYRRYWGDHIHHGLFLTGREAAAQAQEQMVRHCAARVGLQPGMRVADVGCGHGGTANLLAREYSCRVLGLTISQTQLELARKVCGSLDGATRLELADAESYRFPAGSFDVIWNMESCEHFFDKAAYFRKVWAGLKPGGTLLVAAWTGSMQNQLIRNIAEMFLCPDLWTTAEYAQEIESAGMRVLGSEQLASQVARTWDLAAERIRKSRWLLFFLPAQFREFVDGIELMREGYRSGQLTYSVIVARKL